MKQNVHVGARLKRQIRDETLNRCYQVFRKLTPSEILRPMSLTELLLIADLLESSYNVKVATDLNLSITDEQVNPSVQNTWDEHLPIPLFPGDDVLPF